MKIVPKMRGFICTTAHPLGCKENVRQQIEYVKQNGPIETKVKNVLVIGSSTGYGLSSRITAAFATNANTLGVMFEREPTEKKTATPGYYNTKALEAFAHEQGLYAKTINGDAFSREVKMKAIEMIKAELGKVDMVIYSLAAPKRTMEDGSVYSSVLKTTGGQFTDKSLEFKDNTIKEVTLEPSNQEEIDATIKVMGGEDWHDWIDALYNAGVLANDAMTIAYSYVGPTFTAPIYRDGTIGQAKKHLEQTAIQLTKKYQEANIQAYVSVNKALVTQASSAIPIVPLYFTVLYKVMKEKNIHEGCIEQIVRLFKDKLFTTTIKTDEAGLIRLDDWELRADVQAEVMAIWPQLNSDNVTDLADITGYWEDFYHLFGFNFDNVDYEAEVSPLV